MQKPLNAFVDTQTAFVKQIVETNRALVDQALSMLDKFAEKA
jgi:hypothetical protein